MKRLDDWLLDALFQRLVNWVCAGTDRTNFYCASRAFTLGSASVFCMGVLTLIQSHFVYVEILLISGLMGVIAALCPLCERHFCVHSGLANPLRHFPPMMGVRYMGLVFAAFNICAVVETPDFWWSLFTLGMTATAAGTYFLSCSVPPPMKQRYLYPRFAPV